MSTPPEDLTMEPTALDEGRAASGGSAVTADPMRDRCEALGIAFL